MADGARTRVLLGVRGMDNAAARSRVEATLREVGGVASAEASVDGQVAVVYDDAEATIMDLIRTLRRIGFLAGME